ncbi:hypothetical protein [uncultured Winogradskyella sp.]|uniref:hypothetical protein n=1 Tax=uncultured Winogradskyella sp. TaxID=395353 RepID=UPI002622B949|nr:hypothetical protein [uncultured Winogradskyella sp.]
MKKTVPPLLMFFVSIGALAITAITLNTISEKIIDPSKSVTKENYEFVFWFFRVVTALCASAISISIPGMLKVSYNSDGTFIQTQNKDVATLADKQPSIVAGGAIAVFVLVYLFNPIN